MPAQIQRGLPERLNYLIKVLSIHYYGVYGSWARLAVLRDLWFAAVVYLSLRRLLTYVHGHGVIQTTRNISHCIGKRVFAAILRLPPVKRKVDLELQQTVLKIQEEIIKNSDQLLQFPEIPIEGLSTVKVEQELDSLQELKHSDWKNGRVSGAVYHGGKDLLKLQLNAYDKYSVANQLHPDVFPGVRKMEAEVVSMVLRAFNAPASGCGSSTSGGTESLLLAGLAAREYARRHRGVRKPEVIAPVTVHAGIEKACYYFGMVLHKVEVDPKTYKVDLKQVARLINKNTVLLVGSAPNYPHGIIDDIEGLSSLALRHKIPLHVDACLGSFIVAFLDKAGVHKKPVPPFDFRLDGVTSISCDTHKYGFAPKGSSIIMYRDPKLRECQYYVLLDWIGGMYGLPTLAGSRPGALMVGCWATLVHTGEKGYIESCRSIVLASMKFKTAIQENDLLRAHLEVVGDPIGLVVAFKARKNLNIYVLGDVLSKKGWHFASLQRPAALHFAFTRLTVNVVDELIADLVEATEVVAAQKDTANTSDTAAIYGIAGSVQTTGIAERVIVAFLDTLYKLG